MAELSDINLENPVEIGSRRGRIARHQLQSIKISDNSAEKPDIGAKTTDMKAELSDISSELPDIKIKIPDSVSELPDITERFEKIS